MIGRDELVEMLAGRLERRGDAEFAARLRAYMSALAADRDSRATGTTVCAAQVDLTDLLVSIVQAVSRAWVL